MTDGVDEIMDTWVFLPSVKHLNTLEAIEQTAVATREKILAIRELLRAALEEARVRLPKNVYSKELIELIFQQPYCCIKILLNNVLRRNAIWLRSTPKRSRCWSGDMGTKYPYRSVPEPLERLRGYVRFFNVFQRRVKIWTFF